MKPKPALWSVIKFPASSFPSFVRGPSWLRPGPPEQPPHQPSSSHVGFSSTSPCPPRSTPPLSRPRLRTSLRRLCGAPRIFLDIYSIGRHLSGAGTTVTFCLLPNSSLELGGCSCCFPCRGFCPCAPYHAFSLACGEISPTRASLFLSLIHI